ncbi:MAG: hypothetical protein ACLS3S_07500 [Streptococcus salivarius]
MSGYIHFKTSNQELKLVIQPTLLSKLAILSDLGTFRVTSIVGNNITSQDLAGGTPTKHNIVDPGPVLELMDKAINFRPVPQSW